MKQSKVKPLLPFHSKDIPRDSADIVCLGGPKKRKKKSTQKCPVSQEKKIVKKLVTTVDMKSFIEKAFIYIKRAT